MINLIKRFYIIHLFSSIFFALNVPNAYANPLNYFRQSPNSFNFRNTQIKRVFCSVTNMAEETGEIDFHFDSQNGDLYSYDDFREVLRPFRLTDFEFISESDMDDISDFQSIIRGKNLKVRIVNRDPLHDIQSIGASMDLQTLKVQFNVDATNKFMKEENVEYVLGVVSESTKCNYLQPLSFEFE
jgi:hypothetical protein